MFRNKLVHKKKGFTLIELMIVISILLILIGFMIPKFSAYMDKAKNIKAVNTAKQIQTAAMASYGENNGKFDETKVRTTISELTAVTSSDINSAALVGTDGQGIRVNYDSDEKKYIVEINATTSVYTLTEDTTP